MDKIEMLGGELSFAPGSADFKYCETPIICSEHGNHDYWTWRRAIALDKEATRNLRRGFPDAVEVTTFRRKYYEVRPILVEKE